MERRIMVLHRKETTARIVSIHKQLLSALRAAFPHHSVEEFVGSSVALSKAIQEMQTVQIFISPHGAGLTFMQFLRVKAAVIEIGFDGKKSMAWPTHFFAANALSLNLKYYLSVGIGERNTPVEANIEDIIALVAEADIFTRPP